MSTSSTLRAEGSPTYLLAVLAQLCLGGEQGERAGRFPSRWLTSWCLGGDDGQTHREKERERELRSGNREEEEDGRWCQDVRGCLEEERTEGGTARLEAAR